MKTRFTQSIKQLCTAITSSVQQHQLDKNLANSTAVSFDIFDTCLKRNVLHPEDVFDFVQHMYQKEYTDLHDNFRVLRIQAAKSASAKHGEFCNLDHIYNELTLPNATRKRLYDLELKAESLLLTTNPIIKELYDRLKSENCYIIFISDMYLPKVFLEEVLNREGYDATGKVYVSHEFGCSKREGKLFKRVAETVGFDLGQLIHYGDDLHADFLGARKEGAKGILISGKTTSHVSCQPLNRQSSDLVKSLTCATATNLSLKEESFFREFGIKAFGPLLYGFVTFLKESFERDQLDHLYFSSRDGYLPMQLFCSLYPEYRDKVSYLYLSRRSLKLPLIQCVDDILSNLPNEKHTTISELLSYFGLNAKDYANQCSKLGYDLSTTVALEVAPEEQRFIELVRLISDEIIERAAAARNNLQLYLSEYDFSGRVGFIDVGWAGTIQHLLQMNLEVLGINNHICGYYLGVSDDIRTKPINAKAFLGFEHPMEFIGLVELCFLAQEGTTIGWQRNQSGHITPVLAEWEYNGHPQDAAIIQQIQQGALSFAQRLHKLTTASGLMVPPNLAYSSMKSIGTRPTVYQAKQFASIDFDLGTQMKPLAEPQSLLTYIQDPKQLKIDFLTSMWRIGLMKNLVRLPLPYARLYSIVKRHS